MPKRLIWMSVILLSSMGLAYAQLDLRPVHSDESAHQTFEQRFSLDQALSSLEIIRASLQSFQKLTEEVQGKVSREKLKEIGNTDWEMQNLGFRNYPKSIEGALRKQDYQIKKLQYQLAEARNKEGMKNSTELLDAKKAYQQAEKDFQEFWKNFRIAD
jgi:hypothetical protein